ncbi:MAG: DoxX family protein [Euryarchaeota archaeon]|nr:DoxX family protein [Euryarchaeota archaeon]|tara:strand:+ start:1532 stop:1978 length:447 start_codon:yes stop_codon:yes gene_type:complete
MRKINDFLDRIANPISGIAEWLLRLGLGISFFLHGYGKLPISEGFVGWLGSKGVPAAGTIAHLVAWGEILAGLGIILGGVIAKRAQEAGHLITRLSGGAVLFIMVWALILAHSNWGIFFGERGSVLFASEQLFLLLIGSYFAIKGNRS